MYCCPLFTFERLHLIRIITGDYGSSKSSKNQRKIVTADQYLMISVRAKKSAINLFEDGCFYM